MGETPAQTMAEIEETRAELATKVDDLVDRVKVEAGAIGRKMLVGAAALAALLVVGYVAKRRVGS